MATRSAGAKDKVKASAASESARATARSGAPEGSRRVGEGENHAVHGQKPVREAAEEVEGGVPGGTDPECVKERAHGGGVEYGGERPGERIQGEW